MDSGFYIENNISDTSFNRLSYVDELCQYHTSLTSDNFTVPQYLLPLPRSRFTLSSYLGRKQNVPKEEPPKPIPPQQSDQNSQYNESIEKIAAFSASEDEIDQNDQDYLEKYVESVDQLEKLYETIASSLNIS